MPSQNVIQVFYASTIYFSGSFYPTVTQDFLHVHNIQSNFNRFANDINFELMIGKLTSKI